MNNRLDQIIARIQNMHPFNIWQVKPDGSIEPWYEVTGAIVRELVIDENNLGEQVQIVGAQIGQWHRYASLCKRVWEITERHYRVWRDTTTLELLDPQNKPADWKKPTEKIVSATIRTLPEYTKHYEAQERAEEAYNSALGILEGFKAKKEIMRATVVKATDYAAARLAV